MSLLSNGSLLVMYCDSGEFSGFDSEEARTLVGNLCSFCICTLDDMFYPANARNAGGADQLVVFRGDGNTITVRGASTAAVGSSNCILAHWQRQPTGLAAEHGT